MHYFGAFLSRTIPRKCEFGFLFEKEFGFLFEKVTKYPVTILTGPPGAGKTTYALERQVPHVVDIDLISKRLPHHVRMRLRREQVLRLPQTGGIFMTAAPRRSQKEYWVRLLYEHGASDVSVVVLLPPKHVAYERMRARELLKNPHTPGRQLEEMTRGIDKWYGAYEPYVHETVIRT